MDGMKVFGVRDGEPGVYEIPGAASATSSNGPDEAVERLKDECKGWLKYKKMGDKYAIPAKQEFEHMLLALDDTFSRIKKQNLTDHEKAEMKKLTTAIHANYHRD